MIWENINISDVLEPINNNQLVDKETKYKLLGMGGQGKGFFLREEKFGNEVSSIYLNKVSSGLFVYSRLFAWKGSFALVPENLDGTFVSSEFPSFKIDTKKIIPDFLLYYFKLPRVWKEVEKLSIGSTKQSRNRLKEDFFLTLKIPLPPFPIQEKIVQKLNDVVTKSNKVIRLRLKQQKELERLIYFDYLNLINGAERIPFAEISPVVRRPFEPDADTDYIEIGIRSFGNGTFQKSPVKGKQIAHKSLFKMNAGDLIFSNVFSWEAAIALAKPEDDICIGSHRFITTVPNTNKVNPEFLLYHILSPRGLDDIKKASPGTAGRNKTLGF
jgi:type I restriction enzyme S subunit